MTVTLLVLGTVYLFSSSQQTFLCWLNVRFHESNFITYSILVKILREARTSEKNLIPGTGRRKESVVDSNDGKDGAAGLAGVALKTSSAFSGRRDHRKG